MLFPCALRRVHGADGDANDARESHGLAKVATLEDVPEIIPVFLRDELLDVHLVGAEEVVALDGTNT